MSKPQVEIARVHPRRRPVLNADLPSLVTESAESSKMGLKKGETFHTPTSPPSNDRDPVLNIRSLPRRCPTSLEAIAASEERMTSILNRLTLDSPEDSGEEPSDSTERASKAATGPASSASRSRRSSVGDDSKEKSQNQEHGHESDSGLGTSVSSNEELAGETTGNETPQSPITSPISTFQTGTTAKRQLSLTACKQIERYILVPILKDPKLKPFHPLVKSIPSRILNRHILCLRDVEKSLLWLAPRFSNSRHQYLNFAEFTIQCLHTSAAHLNDRDQRLPTDRPYTNGYFLDLVSQVRRYAAMIRANRERAEQAQAQTPASDKENKISLVPSAALEGGLSKNGKPAELVVMQDGKAISMLTGLPFVAEDTPATFKRTISFDERVDEGVQRSMARRKKNAPPMDINQKCSHCDKVFKRPCDLTKHEKTHSRPWKCSDSTCKYYQIGWPTEKERDRHVNDKHSDTPALYKCNFQPCTYASKRESNCKQHMEKAHGWVYLRSKNNARGDSKRASSNQASRTPSVSTPASKSVDFPTPMTGPSPSPGPSSSMFPDSLPFNFNDPPIAHSDDYPRLFETSPYPSSSAGMSNDISFPTSVNLDSFQTQFESGDPHGLISSLEMHRQSMNSISVPSAESVPDLMGMSGYDGSPMAATDNSLNFDFEWGNLDYSEVDADYTSLNMQLQTPAQSEQIYKGYSGQMATGPSHLSMTAPHKMAGLSPNAQGNPMLYSPGSEHYEYGAQHQNGNDFMLYGEHAGMQMAQMIPSMTQHQATRQYAQAQTMFPPLTEQDAVLQGLQSWATEPRQGNKPESYMHHDMELEFMK
ncbi:Zinc finger C2H2 [Penicillium tannophilum]|nr:Zinc finger C2H2 [Penicillium tannophilum]